MMTEIGAILAFGKLNIYYNVKRMKDKKCGLLLELTLPYTLVGPPVYTRPSPPSCILLENRLCILKKKK